MSNNRAKECAKGCLERIVELIERRRAAEEIRDTKLISDIDIEIQESAYGIAVRSDWTSVGDKMSAAEFYILLAGGGPAARLRGDLNEHGEPSTTYIEYQDWFEPWEEYLETSREERDMLKEYAEHFYFGE